jgi:preprotein translocase subunit SecA
MSTALVNAHIEEKSHSEDWGVKAVSDAAIKQFGVGVTAGEASSVTSREGLDAVIVEKALAAYSLKVATVGDETFSQFEKIIMLNTLDNLWKDHLLSMDHLKGGIGLRGYGQKNPLQEYKKEGFDLFVDMMYRLKSEVVERLFKVQIQEDEAPQEAMPPSEPQHVEYRHGEETEQDDSDEEKNAPITRQGDKIGRNDPCPCGSGKKYKKCCGASESA